MQLELSRDRSWNCAEALVDSRVPKQPKRSLTERWRTLACAFAALATASLAAARSNVVAWGSDGYGQCAVPAGLAAVDVAASGGLGASSIGHSLALRSDGSIVGWGCNTSGQCNVPSLPVGVRFAEVAAGSMFSIGRRSDGQVEVWGLALGVPVPPLPPSVTYVHIAAGKAFALALRSDGAVVAWGDNTFGQCNVPVTPPGVNYVEIAAGREHALARRSDGIVVGWGDDSYGLSNVPQASPGVTYVQITSGGQHALALRSDGSIAAWGWNAYGQCNVPALPPGVTYVEVSAGMTHSLARCSDGSVLAWGLNSSGVCNVPALPAGYVFAEIKAGGYHNVARVELTTPRAYCTAGLSGAGCVASIGFAGVPSLSAASGFSISVANVEAQRQGLIFYGISGRAETPWGSGSTSFLCVKSPTQRMAPQNTAGTLGFCDGVLAQDWLVYIAAHPNALGAPFWVGDTIDAQAWYRDPMSSKTTSLSDALEFLLQP